MSRILVVDDEPQLLRAMRINLTARKYEVAIAADGTSALREAATFRPDVVVLDLGLPDIDGVEVIHGLRGWTNVPILVLSGRVGHQDKIAALDAGADDYVTKPFNIEELLARLRAVTRRTAAHEAETAQVTVGEHLVDLSAKAITAPDGSSVHLTPTEWAMLELLVRNPGRLVSQRQLLAEVWGRNVTDTHYLRQYMAQLRRKLEPDPAHPVHLLTEAGMGYRFNP